MNSTFDRAVGILGLVVGITTFVAQGPYEHSWQYAIPFIPIALAVVAIGLHRALPHVTAAMRLYDHTRPLAATHLQTALTLQVRNAEGDVTFSRWYHLRLTKSGVELQEGKKEVLICGRELSDLPPRAHVKKASNASQTMTATTVQKKRIEVGGAPEWRYQWEYEFVPPLAEKGAFVEYTYALDIPGAEAAAFTNKGALFTVEHGALNMQVEAKLIAPPHHTIEILHCYVERNNGHQQTLAQHECPVIAPSGELLTWKPMFRKKSRYVCRYRLIDYRGQLTAAGSEHAGATVR